MLVTVSGAVKRPGVYEIEMGIPAGDVIMLAGGPAERLQALLTGGYFGAWLPVEAAWAAPMTHSGLKAAGGALGAGIVVATPATACPVAETARVVRYLAEESAGQCGPCLHGLPALADALADLAFTGGRDLGAIGNVAELIPLIERRGACLHPDGAAQLVRSLLAAFPEDTRSGRGGWVPAAACSGRHCSRCPTTTKGSGAGDDRHAEGQPDRLRRPRDVRRVAARGRRAGPGGLSAAGLARNPALAARPRQTGRPGVPHAGPDHRGKEGRKAPVTRWRRRPLRRRRRHRPSRPSSEVATGIPAVPSGQATVIVTVFASDSKTTRGVLAAGPRATLLASYPWTGLHDTR